MGSTSITTTTYGMTCSVVNPYFTLSKVDSVIFGQALREISYQRAPAIRIPYLSVDGGDGEVRFRIAMSGYNRFVWKSGSKPRLYGLQRLGEAVKAGYVV